MINKFDKIDFTQEPYKSMVDPDDVEYSKQAIRAMVIILGEPDEKGIFRISKEEVEILNKKFLDVIKNSGSC